MKTIAELITEHRNRLNPEYENIATVNVGGHTARFSLPSNIIEKDGWIEFDTVCDITRVCPDSTITTRHVKMKGEIIEYVQKIDETNNLSR